MNNWLALAQAFHPQLPAEQAERIAPILEALRARFEPLVATLPHDAESATVFQPETVELA